MSATQQALLNAVTRKNSPEADACVNGTFWTTNYYANTREIEDWDSDNYRWTGNWTTETASQEDYTRADAVGKEKDGTAMSDSKARRLLGTTGKYSIKTAK